ncbi:ATP-dependent Clp protease ATP-binding subunit ClpC [Prauserella shujinwangii]|uniref:ATP-dependent Clp protease ATP-binding subunit ClpC n=1 Tax=Prauserella shujinwangii TaxID=1453103 RepID=A0A2T0LZC4_9PSEU|nr:Clp protease N-terminal domain-containing protein [Prauserella shujinwangii]PRX49468.1 ATP-dependent Clp protease ATP-binding subunit ClpC [Prauserella shujinwangii]
MPKINVYLPDELAEGVRDTGLPVSAICQRALEQSVRRVTAIRAAVLGDLDGDDPAARLSHFTERARAVLRLAVQRARTDGAAEVGTEHLLDGVLAEGTNLALLVLRAVDVEPDVVGQALAGATDDRQGDGAASRFSAPAANALELTATEAAALGHNYVGCEHLLLGLLSEPDGTAGHVLRELGLDLRTTRRAVVAALSGYTHLRAQAAQPRADLRTALADGIRAELRPVLDRLDRLERHVGLDPEA